MLCMICFVVVVVLALYVIACTMWVIITVFVIVTLSCFQFMVIFFVVFVVIICFICFAIFFVFLIVVGGVLNVVRLVSSFVVFWRGCYVICLGLVDGGFIVWWWCCEFW